MKEQIGNVLLDYSNYTGDDGYEDGYEDELLEIVTNHSEDQYNKVIYEKGTWGLLYHLSDIRTNIISWLPINKDDKVLEIGSGCGAITTGLVEMAGRVDCVELSQKRSVINATRNSEANNLNIFVGNFQDIEKKLDADYDYVILIGVLEYAEKYIESKKAHEEFLNIIKSHVADGGVVIVAIENKFGLKYWAGCREDHLGTFYSGLEGYETTSGVRTFSLPELKDLLKKCEFSEYQFYYPYPDYKLPNKIFSDLHLPSVGELNDNIRNFDMDRMLVFNEASVFDEIIKSNMFPFFSNSFLIIIRK